ncbi:hypothetical protein [Caldalkalibacillus mannanilyticus]|uniref:hypothetical protein n=1 Tax=Caldalkalibacillus mannanilyticus TaxID=1418 RepID=UPI000469FAE3|nr:hypothetical protein [Caldalkalibacillus mannanilyticus]
MYKQHYMLLLLLLFFIAGCNNNNINYEEDDLYQGSGKVVFVTPKDGNVLPNKSKARYTLSLHGFKPEGKEFDTYNRTHSAVREKPLEITDNTKIYDENGTEIDPTDIEVDSIVEFKYIIAGKYQLEAFNVTIVKRASEASE